MGPQLRFLYRKEVKLTILLALLLLFATSSWASDDVKQTEKGRIPIVSGLLDKVKKKMKNTKASEVIMEEPVCSAEGGGDAKCQDSADKPDTVDTTSDVVVDAAANTIKQEDDEKPQIIKVGSDGVLHLRENTPDNSENIFTCKDRDEKCEELSQYDLGPGKNVCLVHSAYMTQYCPLTCNTCELVYFGHRMSTTMLEGGLAIMPFCEDNVFECKHYADMGECAKNPKYMEGYCGASCGVCSEKSNQIGVGQKLSRRNPEENKRIVENIDKSSDYMHMVKRNRKYKKVRDDCVNRAPLCALWATQGECEKNEMYMKTMCAPSCMACDFLGDVSDQCPGLPVESTLLWKPGDLNAFFEEVVDNVDGKGEQYSKYNPQALSRPKLKSNGYTAPNVKEDGPWIVLFENFLSDEEADRLVAIGHQQGYERSKRSVGQGKSDVTETRTSTNTWCQDSSCMEDPLVAPVLKRIATATKSTIKHSEHIQLLKYEPEQFYKKHHDMIPYQLDLPCGPRIITIFLYLNDVEEGGNTSFPELGISVKPKKGSALLWPNVKDEDPIESDRRTEHQAEAVIKGVKYGANAWVHLEDFQTPFALGCL